MAIRKAVAAIIYQDDTFLLARKVLMSDAKNGPQTMAPEWNFVQGGVKEGENSLDALHRELKEETGMQQYEIVKELEKFSFDFVPEVQEKLGFTSQEMRFYLVKYLGNGSDITLPVDGELDKLEFFTYDEVLELLHHENSKEYFQAHVR